jgi:curved DNA-binding protein CbpA
MNIDYLNIIASLFFKLASFNEASELLRSGNIEDAAQILGINPSANAEEIKTAFRRKAMEWHPDKNKSPNATKMMQLINAANHMMINKDKFLLSKHNQPKERNVDFDYDFYPPYEDIAKMRREMGREEFDKKHPGWIGELRSEMGLNEYNKIFEGYDPNYNPEDDPDYMMSQEQILEQAYETIADSIDLDDLENKIENMSSEEKLFLIRNLKKPEELKQIIGLETITPSKLSKKDLAKLEREVFEDKIKNLIKLNESCFSGIVSLKDIVENPKEYIILYNPKEHLASNQIKELITEDFVNFIIKIRTEQFSHFSPALKARNDITLLNDKKKCHMLATLLVEYYKHQGKDTYNVMVFSDIFEELKNQNIFVYNRLVRIANPANYIK